MYYNEAMSQQEAKVRPSDTEHRIDLDFRAMLLTYQLEHKPAHTQLISLHMERPWVLQREIYGWCG